MKSKTKFLIVSVLFFLAGMLQLNAYYFADGDLLLGAAGWFLTISGVLYFIVGQKANKSK